MPPEVAVVVPTFNEADNLSSIAQAIRLHGYDLFIVDDSSPDGTGRLAEELAAGDPHITAIHRPTKQGLGPAYSDGFAAALTAGTPVVCQMDADFSHDPSALPSLLDAIEGGADVAIGSRYVPGGEVSGWPIHRRLISRFGNSYARAMLATPIRDMTSGFRAYRSEVLTSLHPATCEASGYGFQVEMARRSYEAGARVIEVPITFRNREKGESKMTWGIALEAMWLVTVWGVKRKLPR